MNINRINDYINAYSKAIEMPEEYVEILKELMPKIIYKYEKIYPFITTLEDDYDKYIIKPKDGGYTTEDFFLNRLMRNVWSIELNGENEGQYSTNEMIIKLNPEKIENQLKDRIPLDNPHFEEWNQIAKKKVVMHEFEHALQTSYNKSALNNIYKMKYKNIIEELENINNGMYKDEINTYKTVNNTRFGKIEEYNHSGTLYSHNAKDVKNYRQYEGIKDLNEIMNEVECLEMAGAKQQGIREYKNGAYYSFKNIECSNYSITNYGELIKLLLGKKLSFIGEYLNPSTLYNIFNSRYNSIFKSEFGADKNALEHLVIQLRKIKTTDDFEEHVRLEKVLAKCFEKNIEKSLGRVDIITLQKKLEIFRSKVINCDEQENRLKLEHINILNQLQKELIDEDIRDER